MPTIAVSATSVPGLAARSVRLHARVAASKVATAAALPNRELRRPPLFLVSLYPRELRADERPMDRALFNLRRRVLADCNLDAFGLNRFGLCILNAVVVDVRIVWNRISDESRRADGRSFLRDLDAV